MVAAIVFGGEQVLKHDLGYCIAIGVYERLVHGVGPEFSGMRRRQRVDIQDQDGPVRIIGLLKRIKIGDIDPRVHCRGIETRGVQVICHILPLCVGRVMNSAEAAARAADEQDPRQPSSRHGSL